MEKREPIGIIFKYLSKPLLTEFTGTSCLKRLCCSELKMLVLCINSEWSSRVCTTNAALQFTIARRLDFPLRLMWVHMTSASLSSSIAGVMLLSTFQMLMTRNSSLCSSIEYNSSLLSFSQYPRLYIPGNRTFNILRIPPKITDRIRSMKQYSRCGKTFYKIQHCFWGSDNEHTKESPQHLTHFIKGQMLSPTCSSNLSELDINIPKSCHALNLLSTRTHIRPAIWDLSMTYTMQHFILAVIKLYIVSLCSFVDALQTFLRYLSTLKSWHWHWPLHPRVIRKARYNRVSFHVQVNHVSQKQNGS